MESREDKMVVIKRDAHGKPVIWCDPEIVDLVTALNDGGLPTSASCSGHGYRPGRISLADGRELFVARGPHDVECIEAAFPLDINGQTKAERDAWANKMAAADDKASDVAPTLKPCPFCGAVPTQRAEGLNFQHPAGECFYSESTIPLAMVGAWNSRAALSVPNLPKPK